VSGDAQLIFPPGFHPGQPFLALPQLKSFLKTHGFSSKVLDWNLDYYLDNLKKIELENGLKQAVNELVDLQEQENLLRSQRERLSFLKYCLHFSNELKDRYANSLNSYKNEDFYNLQIYEQSKKDVKFNLRIQCLKHPGSVLSPDVYYPKHGVHSLTKLQLSVSNPKSNLMYQWLDSRVAKMQIDSEIVGINATERGQFHSALTTAHLLRKHGYKGTITLGGSYITRLKPKVDLLTPFLNDVDYFCFHEGEWNLINLFQRIRNGGGSLNAFFKENGKIQLEEAKHPPVTDHFLPDFTDLKLNEYLSPELVLPFQTKRGCPYGKCSFCEHPVFMDEGGLNAGIPSTSKVIDGIVEISRQTGAQNFYFVDEMLTPLELDSISERIEPFDFHWIAYAYLSAGMSHSERVKEWKGAGLTKLWIGLESTDELVLRKMEKHRKADLEVQCFQAFQKAGLPIHLFTLFGFPGESLESMQNTVQDLKSWAEFLDSKHFSLDLFRFNLAINTPAWRTRNTLGIQELPQSPAEDDLEIAYSNWKLDNGLTSREVEDFIETAWPDLNLSYKDSALLPLREVQDSYHLLWAKYDS